MVVCATQYGAKRLDKQFLPMTMWLVFLEETEKLVADAQEGTVYQIQPDHESLYQILQSCFNICLVLHSADLFSQQTYNKCVTAYAQDPLDRGIAQLSSDLFDKYEIFKSRDMLLEWSPKNVHKANGLEKLIAHLELNKVKSRPAEMKQMTCSYDKWAGLGVAIKCSSSSQRSRQCSDADDE